ncbi:MAG: hypothetical protein AAGF53_08075 [Pseudomonadota bacterium]
MTKSVAERKLTRTERILEPFGAALSSELIRYFDMIADYDCDVVIFMARKSLCLYRMVQLCGSKPISVPIFSDTILEGQADLLEGKRVLVVDDTLFVGTTLADASEKLSQLNVAESRFWVFCVDTETVKEKKFSPDYVHKEMTEQDAIEFCAAECRALINSGIPYLTDFAASRRIRMTANQLDRVIKPVNWHFHDVSSQYHDVSKVKYYSGIPDQFTQEQVKTLFGSNIFELIEISKIRVFATWSGRAYDVTFVPLVTFAPCRSEMLKKVGIAVGEAFGIPSDLLEKLTASDQMRLLQFLVGAAFMKSMWRHVEQILPVDPNLKHSFEWCQSVFPADAAERVSAGINMLYAEDYEKFKVKHQMPKIATEEPQSVVEETRGDISKFLNSYFSSCDDVDLGHYPLSDLTALMLEFQSHFEDKARREIVEDDPNPKYRDRLKRGMAWRALCSYLLERYGSENTRHHRNVLSLFLDRLVDFGIAVPIISQVDGLIYRAYRHGEDVRFGAQEESLVHHLLDGFQVGRSVEGIEATYIEKLLVILLRVGMNEEWLNLWYSNSPRDNLVRVGYHLQGAIPISPRNDDELVPEGETSWLTRRLCKTGTISKSTDESGKVLYGLGVRPTAAHARRDARRTSKLLGHAVGKACVFESRKRTQDRPLATEDLIVLTSCSNGIDTTGAVAAEVILFADWFQDVGTRVLVANFAAPGSSAFKINVERGHGAQAINSADWKIRNFRGRQVEEIRKKVYATQDLDPEFFAREDIWEAVFASFDRKANDGEQRKIDVFLDFAQEFSRVSIFLLDAIAILASLGRDISNKQNHKELSKLIGGFDFPDFISGRELKQFAHPLSQDKPKDTLVEVVGTLARELLRFGQRLCLLGKEEALSAISLANKANTRLSRREYRYMVWYDILDVRVRRAGSPDAADRYVDATNQFRAQVSAYLDDFTRDLREEQGEVLVHSGEIRSVNDEKHIFLSGKGSQIDEARCLVCDIKRIAQRTGVKVRMLAVPTNLRGEFVYVNRGHPEVGGDFMSHVHTLIGEIKHHRVEEGLNEGDSVVWVLAKHAKSFKGEGSVSLSPMPGFEAFEFPVTIRNMTSVDKLRVLG